MERLERQIKEERNIDLEQALQLIDADLEELMFRANRIRRYFCSDSFDTCTIINGKSGHCQEDCKFCSQSSFNPTDIERYGLLEEDQILSGAFYNEKKGIRRYSIVTSGRALEGEEFHRICANYHRMSKECSISLCASHGLLSYQNLVELKKVGVSRYHNNLETSRRYFPLICTTHTYDHKIEVILNAQKAGLEVCSGGVFGMGETMEDRLDMAFDLRSLGIRSIPLNILNPIPNTPLRDRPSLSLEEVCRIVAIYRFILPQSWLRLAGGRNLLTDQGRDTFCAGANAIITGDFLTTSGCGIDQDLAMISSLGFELIFHE